MQPFSGNQRPDLLTALMNMSLVLRLPWKMHLCRSSSNAPRLSSFLEMRQNPLTLDKVHNPLRLPRESTSERPKMLRTPQFFVLLTSKCASRRNGVHFFDIATSKSGPNIVCFAHFDLEMCFAPQRRALFRHRNLQKWSGPGVFCTFCDFEVSIIWPHGSAPAALVSLLFDPPEPQISGKTPGATNQWKNSVSQLVYLFARLDLLSSETFSFLTFFLLLFSSLTLPVSAFHLSILSEV